MKVPKLYCRIKNKQHFDITPDHPMYCCQAWIDGVINEDAVPVSYNPKLRYYYLICDTRVSWVQIIKRCFQCNHKFPEDLYEKRLEVLEKEYGITEDSKKYVNAKLPAEFYTEEWWRKRGI